MNHYIEFKQSIQKLNDEELQIALANIKNKIAVKNPKFSIEDFLEAREMIEQEMNKRETVKEKEFHD
jgi:hypothetical protein